MSKNTERELRQRITKLMAQNNRFREVIETLAGRSQLQREYSSHKALLTCTDEFEEFAPPRTPRLKISRSTFGGSSAKTAIQDNTWFPVFGNNFRPLEPTPGWRCLSARHAPIRLGFNLVGMDAAQVEDAVAKVEQRQLRDRDFIPVFITDVHQFQIFRSRGYVFEYIPPPVSNPPKHQRAERRYLKQRLELIKAKWDLRDIIDLSD